MSKRKASSSSQDSNDSDGTKRPARGTSSQSTSSQSTERSSSSSQPLPKLATASFEDDEDIASDASSRTFLTRTETNNMRQQPTLQQESAQHVGISRTLAARTSSPIPTTNRVTNLASAYPVLSAAYPAYTSAASAILSSNSANNTGAGGSIPQMTYQTYQSLLRMLGHVEGTPGPARNTPVRVSLSGYNLGPRSDRKTDFRMDQAKWSVDNLPEIIYAFEPPNNYYHANMLKDPPLKPYTVHGVEVRDIPILPDRISPDPEGWLYECWCRFDPRINYKRDIEPRIRPDQRPDYPTRFSRSRLRFRQDCHLLAWVVKGKHYEKDKNDIINAATKVGIDVKATNSTRGLTWGLADPTKGEASRRIHIPAPLRPKNTRDDGPSVRNVLSTPESHGTSRRRVVARRATRHHPGAAFAAPQVRPGNKASVHYPATATSGEKMTGINAQAQGSASPGRDMRLSPLNNDVSNEQVEKAPKQTPSVPSHGNASVVYEGYEQRTERFIQHASGIYLPVSSENSSITTDTKEMDLTPTSQQPKSHPIQPIEYNFEQKDKILEQAANEARKNKFDLPGQEATTMTNKLVEDFYERDGIQLLDTTGNQWESTRLDYIEFCGRVDYNPAHFHEYFPRLMEAVRRHVRTMLKKSSTVSRKTSWPDSRVPEEEELYEKVWNFERRRWNWYARLGSGIERF